MLVVLVSLVLLASSCAKQEIHSVGGRLVWSESQSGPIPLDGASKIQVPLGISSGSVRFSMKGDLHVASVTRSGSYSLSLPSGHYLTSAWLRLRNGTKVECRPIDNLSRSGLIDVPSSIDESVDFACSPK